jgi:hypothetical protein
MSGDVIETTVTMILDLDGGRDFVFLGDLNILVFSSRLSRAERAQALDEWQCQMRRSVMHVIHGDVGSLCPEVA